MRSGPTAAPPHSVVLQSRAGPDGIERLTARLAAWRARADDLVRRQPLRLVAAAAALGYTAGLLMRRPAAPARRRRRR